MYYWKYLQIVNADFFINVILHKNSMFGINDTPYISYCIYSRKLSCFIHKRVRIPRMDEHIFEFEYGINCRSPFVFESENLVIDGSVITKSEPGPTFQILSLQENDKGGTWKVLIPRGKFEGYIRTDYFEGVFKADIYQDEQCGGHNLQETLRRWVWYSVVEEGEAHVYFSTESVDGSVKSIDISVSDSMIYKESGSFNEGLYNSILYSKAEEGTVNLPLVEKGIFELKNGNIIRNRENERYGAYYFNYKRFVAETSCGADVSGACEIMSFEKKTDLQ